HFFISDDKVAKKIRAGVGEKIATFAPGAPRLAERVALRFDAFPALGERDDQPIEFRLEHLSARWLLAFANDSLWEGKQGLGGDHGLQTLETMRTLVEWKYMLGLDENPEGGFYGGLTLDIASGGQVLAGPFDPRKDPGSKRFFSGT